MGSIFGRDGRAATAAPPRFGCALALGLLTAALLWSSSALGARGSSGEPVMTASAAIAPTRLPRARRAPATLSMGFTSEDPSSQTIPELRQVELEVSRDFELRTAGLPSCPLARLRSAYSNARQACAGSLVGHGSVTSEITLPGREPVVVSGRLLAYFSSPRQRGPYVLAQVTTGEPLPLTYVIPFEIDKAKGPFGASLVARHMNLLQGICVQAHPDCFSDPYELTGVYGHISKFELSLHRVFTHAGKKRSFLSGRCPAPGKAPVPSFPLTQTNLAYATGPSLSATVAGECGVSPG